MVTILRKPKWFFCPDGSTWHHGIQSLWYLGVRISPEWNIFLLSNPDNPLNWILLNSWHFGAAQNWTTEKKGLQMYESLHKPVAPSDRRYFCNSTASSRAFQTPQSAVVFSLGNCKKTWKVLSRMVKDGIFFWNTVSSKGGFGSRGWR